VTFRRNILVVKGEPEKEAFDLLLYIIV